MILESGGGVRSSTCFSRCWCAEQCGSREEAYGRAAKVERVRVAETARGGLDRNMRGGAL